MKRVLLIGDSIRIGYQDLVKELLKEDCEVFYCDDNSRFVQYLYWQLNQMYHHHGHFDIVHFNSGYWDMNIEAPMKEALNPIPEYIDGLKKIVSYIKSQNSLPIFANTCPIYFDGSGKDNSGTNASLTYRNEWVIQYNEASESFMRANQIQVNDLYTEMLKGKLYYKCPDMLHLSDEGNRVCAEMVAKIIKMNL